MSGPSPASPTWRRTAVSVAGVAALFNLIVAAVLMWNHQPLQHDQIAMGPTLAPLKMQLQQEPKNQQLIEQIRTEDQRLRQQFFGRQRRSEQGAWLLLAGCVVMVVAALLGLARDPAPRPGLDEYTLVRRDLHHPSNITGVVMGVMALLGVVAGLWLAQRDLPMPLATAAPTGDQPVAPREPIFDQDAWDANWPCFRGPRGDGVVLHGADKLPRSWNGEAEFNVLWAVEVPLSGRSSPVVWGAQVYCTGADEAQRAVYAFDVATGTQRWVLDTGDIPGRPGEPPRIMEDTGFAAPTPVVDGQRVYAIFANGDLVAADAVTGRRVWAVSLGRNENDYGYASSLTYHRGRVIVQWDQAEAEDIKSALIAYDGATGAIAWRSRRPVRASWSSPITAPRRDGVWLLMTIADPYVMAHDPITGKELWRVEGMTGDVAPAPLLAQDRVIAVSPNDQTLGIDAGAGAAAWRTNEAAPDIPSPACVGDRAILLGSNGTLTALNVADGAPVWQQRLSKRYHASPLVVGDELWLTATDGATQRMDVSGAEPVTLEQCDLGQPVEASIAAAGGRLFIRTETHLLAIGEGSP